MKQVIKIKHDTEEHWRKAINFIPKDGEMIIYDGVLGEDGQYISMPRLKIGDGQTNINDLPFILIQNEAKSNSKFSDGILEI